MDKCVFCDVEVEEREGDHHVLPQAVRKQMGWSGKKFSGMQEFRVPICGECHKKLHLLTEPLVQIIKWLRRSPPLPMDFIFMLKNTTTKLRGEDQKTE